MKIKCYGTATISRFIPSALILSHYPQRVLTPGTKADIIAIDLNDITVGPYEDPIRTLIVRCTGGNAKPTTKCEAKRSAGPQEDGDEI